LCILGYRPDEATTNVAAPEAAIVVVCPEPADGEGLAALDAIVECETDAERTAYVFVLPGALERLRTTLEDFHGGHYFALLERAVSTDVLERQLDLATRWLDTVLPRIPLHLLAAQPELALA
jgi:hypothetical protein